MSLNLGILGGGQLGRMLIQASLNFDLTTFILDPDDNAPCRNCCSNFYKGSLSDFDTVYNFGKKVDLLTIEFEHINTEALEKLEKEGLKIYPQPHVLKIIQDKGLQKQFYKQHNIPTADFQLINNKNEIQKQHLPIVQKLRKFGYDGKGVIKLHRESDLEKAFNEPSILEKTIEIQKEIAIIAARNPKGQVAIYPPIEMVFHPEVHLVHFLCAPARIEEKIAKEAEKIAMHIANSLKIVGLLAVEMFLTPAGEILVNEIAPRPHNSGHHTIEANVTSQYEQHLRAILNIPLGSTKIISPTAMVNLLGEKGYEGLVRYQGLEEIFANEKAYLHLYGKKYTKPHRKMGHLTILDSNLEKAIQTALQLQSSIKILT